MTKYKYTQATDNLVARKKALAGKLDNATRYLVYGTDGKIKEFKLDSLAADQEALRVIDQELKCLDVQFTREEILRARGYWEALTALELFEGFKHYKARGDYEAQGDFASYLVHSAYESWYCQAYDC